MPFTEHEPRADALRGNGVDHHRRRRHPPLDQHPAADQPLQQAPDRLQHPPPEKILLPREGTLPPIRRFDDDVVADVGRRVMETAEPLVAIAAETGVAQTTILRWMRENDWRRPADAPPSRVAAKADFAAQREKLMARLYRALGRQLEAIERRGREGNDGDMTEKDARALGHIAKTIDTLSTLDRDDGGMRQEPESFDRGTVEADLAEKIRRWAAGET